MKNKLQRLWKFCASLCASLYTSVVILALFFILVALGTWLQVQHGLWAAQELIFYRWIALIPVGKLYLPLPGLLTVGLLAIINIAGSLFYRFKWNLANSGLIALHFALLLLLISGALGFKDSRHYVLDLGPGEKQNQVFATDLWELGLRVEDDSGATWYLQTLRSELLQKSLDLGPNLSQVKIIDYAPHGALVNESVIPLHQGGEGQEWEPAVIVAYQYLGERDTAFLSPSQPLHLVDFPLQLRLRKKSHTLGFSLSLRQFVRKEYPGTTVAQSYESHLELQQGGQSREIVIKMNQPLRVGDYTIYQDSWRLNPTTQMEHAIFAVVYNPWRTLPYYATLLLGIALLWHILLRRFKIPRRCLPAIVVAILIFIPNIAQAGSMVLAPPELAYVPLISEGRVKPVVAHAQNLLWSFSGKRSTKATQNKPKTDALSWWFNSLMQPASTQDIPVFLIENPELRDALGLQGADRDFYSWEQLNPKILRLDTLASRAFYIAADNQSIFDKEVLRLHQLLHQYLHLIQTHLLFEANFAQNSDFSQNNDLAQNSDLVDQLSFLVPDLDEKTPKNEENLVMEQTFGLWQELYRCWGRENQNSCENSSQNLVQHYQKLMPQWQAALKSEVILWRYAPFKLAAMSFALALILGLFAVKFKAKFLERGALGANIVALILMLFAMVLRFIITQRPPVTNLYETLIFVAICTTAILLYYSFTLGKVAHIYAAGIGSILLLLAQKFGAHGEAMPVLEAVLNSNFWLSTHVITISLGYGLIIVSGVVAHGYLWFYGRESQAKPTFKTVYNLQLYGLFFSFMGTLLGAIWANQSWGRFWGWDPKENGALMIVLWSALLLHALPAGLAKPRIFAVGAILGIFVVLFAWFGVNSLGIGLHSYGFTQGRWWPWALYGAIQLFLIVILWRRSSKAKLS